MFDPDVALAERFGAHLSDTYRARFGDVAPGYALFIAAAARDSLACLAGTDAAYHDARHTVMVTLCAQALLLGRWQRGGLAAPDWLHAILAALYHDIGYVRGALAGDRGRDCVIDDHGGRMHLPAGASDAALTPHHVARSRMAVRERFALSDTVCGERLAAMIERTRFPVPRGPEHAPTDDEAGLTRAADLIGQLSDPRHGLRVPALYREFVETGTAEVLGLSSAEDLRARTPAFYAEQVAPHVGPALDLLALTAEGRRWLACLERNLWSTGLSQAP